MPGPTLAVGNRKDKASPRAPRLPHCPDFAAFLPLLGCRVGGVGAWSSASFRRHAPKLPSPQGFVGPVLGALVGPLAEPVTASEPPTAWSSLSRLVFFADLAPGAACAKGATECQGIITNALRVLILLTSGGVSFSSINPLPLPSAEMPPPTLLTWIALRLRFLSATAAGGVCPRSSS